MHFAATRDAGQVLIRFMSASAVSIALMATLTTPQSAGALQVVAATAVVQSAPAPAGQADSNTPASGGSQAPAPSLVGVGFGWG